MKEPNCAKCLHPLHCRQFLMHDEVCEPMMSDADLDALWKRTGTHLDFGRALIRLHREKYRMERAAELAGARTSQG